MANSSKTSLYFPVRPLPNKPASKSANLLVVLWALFHVMEHLGKLNIRGDNSLKAAVKAATGCNFPPAKTTSKPLVSDALSGLDPMNIFVVRKRQRKSAV